MRTLRKTSPVAAGLATCWLLVGAAASATLSAGNRQRVIQEASLTLSIRFEGQVARVESRQSLVNTGTQPTDAIYRFELPANATVIGLEVRTPGASSTTQVVVGATAAITEAPDASGIRERGAAPDVALLRIVEADPVGELSETRNTATTRYELRLSALKPGAPVHVTTRWLAPLRYRDGRLSLRVPDRGETANLVRERIALRVRKPAGAHSIGTLYAAGRLLHKGQIGPRRTINFDAPARGDLVIEAHPTFKARRSGGSSRALRVGFSSTRISDGFGAYVVSILAMPVAAPAESSYERVVFVLDVSRSIGNRGVAAARKLVSRIASSLSAETDVHAVLFDRKPRELWPDFRRNTGQTRELIASALADGKKANGSDLGLALEHVQQLIRDAPLSANPRPGFSRGEHASTLLILISDGVTPLALTGARAVDLLGDSTLENVQVLSITTVPDGAPVPDTQLGAMAELARRSYGLSVGIRYAETAQRGAELIGEVHRPPPWTNLTFAAGRTQLESVRIPVLPAGSGTILTGWYYGKQPRKPTMTTVSGGDTIEIPVKPADAALAKATLALALARATPDDFVLPMPSDEPEGRESLRHLLEAAARAGAITPYSSIVALKSTDRFAKTRLHMVRTWGPGMFFRLSAAGSKAQDLFETFHFRDTADSSRGWDHHSPWKHTGTLDRDIITRLIKTYVVPKAKRCFERRLQSNTGLNGSLLLVLELSRGEVQAVEILHSTFSGPGMEKCVENAAYSISVPRVALGTDSETIAVVRYPLNFRKIRQSVRVERGALPQPRLNLDDPLGSITE